MEFCTSTHSPLYLPLLRGVCHSWWANADTLLVTKVYTFYPMSLSCFCSRTPSEIPHYIYLSCFLGFSRLSFSAVPCFWWLWWLWRVLARCFAECSARIIVPFSLCDLSPVMLISVTWRRWSLFMFLYGRFLSWLPGCSFWKEVTMCSPHFLVWVLFHLLEWVYLCKLIGNFLHERFVFSPFIYLFNHLSVSAWTHGYLLTFLFLTPK